MTTQKEISATEKLLDLIRASSATPTAETTSPQEPTDHHQSGLSLEEISFGHEATGPAPAAEYSATPSAPAAASPADDSISFALKATDAASPASGEAGRLEIPIFSFKQPRSSSFSQAPSVSRIFQCLRPQTKTTIAIDIQPGMIHLIKTRTSKRGNVLLACQTVPYLLDPNAKQKNFFDDPLSKESLFTSLSAMVGRHGQHEIWCSYCFCAPVSLHNISIPKVPEKDIANAVFWSAKRELEFDEEISLFDYSILQEVNEGNLTKIQTLVTLVPRNEVQGVESMFRNAGFPLTGLTFPGAAIQNFLNQNKSIPLDKPVAYFTTRKSSLFIDLFYQGKMFFSREIKTGIDSFVESLQDQAASRDIHLDEKNAKEYLFRLKGGMGQARPGNDEFGTLFDFENLAVIDRLVRQLVRTFEYCGTTFKIPPASKIFTSGEYTVNDTILQTIEKRLDIKCAVIDPLSPKIFNDGIEPSIPNSSDLLVATGLSVANRQTTANFLFTYAERQQESASNRINTIIAIATICLTIGCGAFYAWQYNRVLDKQMQVAGLRAELDHKYQTEPRSRSNDYATQTIRKISQFHRDNKEKVKRFKVIAMLNELTRDLGPEIKLTDLTLEPGPRPEESRLKRTEPSPGTVQLSGYIGAPPESQEFILMNFLKTLSSLDLLTEPDLKSSEKASVQGQEVLRFEINLKTTLAFLEPPPS